MPPKKVPKYPCGTCNKAANTNALLCNFCNMWHHATTECIPWHSKETIDALINICQDQSCWSCQKCSGIMKKLNGRLAKLEKEVTEVKANVEKLSDDQKSTDDAVAELRDDLATVKKSVADKSNDDQSDLLLEMKDREDRKYNVIVNGLRESNATVVEEVRAEENELLNKLFNDMQIDGESTSASIKFKTRLGAKQPGKNRPFLLKFRDRRTRENVLRNASRLPSTGVRVKPDLTKEERDEDDKFKRILDEENNAEPKDESGDFRWKVAGPPGNLRKVKVRNIAEWEQAQKRRTERQQDME